MKLKGSKKIVSLFLAVLMVVSSVPAFALNASAAVNTSTDVSVLRDAIDAYETKMTSGKIYTNMANAYTYYIAAQKAYDACVYGYNDAYVAKATTDLTNATNAMTEWKAYTASKWGTFDGEQDEQATEENYKKFYKNVLYSTVGGAVGTNTVNLGNRGFATATCYDKSTFYYPETVLMYDGTTDPQMGVVYSSIFDANRKYNVIQTHQAVLKSNYGGLKLANERWKGTDTRSNFIWMIQWADDDIYSTTGHESHNSKEHGENETYWSNVIKYDASAEGFASGEYLKTYKPTFSARMWNGYRSDYDNDVTSSVPIYVFNYKAVIDKVNSLAGKIPNVKNYLNGGLSTALATIDKLTTDPNSFFTSSNDINGCVENYSNAISNVDSQLSSVTADSTGYKALREAITNADTVSTAKTADSLVAYGNAISAARNVFANDVATRGYDSPDVAQTKATALNNAKSALVDAYSDSTKDNFDAAVTVVKAMDMDALTADGQAYIQNLIDTSTANLTTTLNDSDKTYYALATGQSVDTAKNITDSAVDELTKALLTFAASPDESYINHYNVTFAAQIEKNDATTDLTAKTFNNQAYGTMITFDADSFSEISALENKSIKWTVQYSYPDGSTKSQKIQSVGNSITLKATANMTVTAIVADETADETVTNYTVKFYNIYNNVVDFTYITEDQLPEAKEYTGSQITIGDYTYTPDVPFYTLSGFKVSAPNANKVISVYPTYSATPTVDVRVYMGTATSKYMTGDAVVTAKTVFLDTSVDNFYAWAVQINGKYQVVAYNKDYAFAAITGATYTPIIKKDGVYKVYKDNNGTLINLTADDVYQFNNNSQYKLTDNDYLVAKLDTKAPFTYIETITTVNGKNRAYIRITANSSSVDSFGVFGNNSKKPLSGVNDITGQYSVDMSKLPADFKAYVSYSVKYTDKDGNTYNISTTDYATNA